MSTYRLGFTRVAAAILLVAGPVTSPVRAGVTPDHLVIGEGAPGDPPLTLHTDPALQSGSGHGPSITENQIIPVRRMSVGSSVGRNVFQRPDLGGWSFATDGFNDLGLDYAAAPHHLALSKLPGAPANFTVSIRRIACDRPADFAVYTPTGAPRLLEDGGEYPFGDAFNGGHVHPFWLMRRPGQVAWTIRFTSDQWNDSADYTFQFTSVPGRGQLVPIDLTAAFNADLIDSDDADAPTPFEGTNRYWLLNGRYGTAAGLPQDGRLAGFQMGGPTGAAMLGAASNALFDDGVLSLASTIDLTASSTDDFYLGVEFLLAASGSIGASDTVNVTFAYDDATTQSVALKRATSSMWHPYAPFGPWHQAAAPRPQSAGGARGPRTAGFASSTGTGVATGDGEHYFLFRAGVPVHEDRRLIAVTFADYSGTGRVALFAMLGVRRAPLEIVTDALPAAAEGQPYVASITAEGTPPYKNWMATGLPAGLTIDPDTGVISGTPAPGSAAAAPFAVTVSVDDSLHDFDPSYAAEHAVRELTLSFATLAGDIDADGDVDSTDAQLFAHVLLGLNPDFDHLARSDINNDGVADGDDIQSLANLLP